MKLQERMESFIEIINKKDGTWARDIDFWEWNSGVGIFGIKEAWKTTESEKFLSFLREWFKKNITSRNTGCVNCVIPATSLIFLYDNDKSREYKEVLEQYAKWCQVESLKTENGGISHFWNNSGVDGIENQLWADSIFMAVMFMIEYAALSKNKELFNEAVEQLNIHTKCLFDENSNLFYHGYDCKSKKNLGQFWGRGNGWVVATLAKVIPIIEANGYETKALKEIFIKVIEKAYSCQTEKGLLRTIINDEEAYEEMSGTMLFGYASVKGVQMGILPDKYIDWVKKIYKTIEYDEEGCIKYMSAGTNPEVREVYLTKPFRTTCYNIGISLMFLAAVYSLNK